MPRLTRKVAPFAVTLIVALTLLVPAAYLFGPALHRWSMLLQLTDDDLADREAALNYVIRHARDDERVARGAAARLGGADDANFGQIVAALTTAGAWDRRHVPPGSWLRWLSLVAANDDPEVGVFVAQRLAELPQSASDDRLLSVLRPLLESGAADVRYNALATCASLVGSLQRRGDSLSPYTELLVARTRDAEPAVARHAWILLGLLRATEGVTADWHAAPPEVAEAMLWALTVTRPQQPTAALAALHDSAGSTRTRAAAAYALAFSDTDAARQALLAAASPLVPAVTDANQLVIWRALLGLPKPDLNRRPTTPLEEVMGMWAADESADPLLEPIALAAVYRLGIAGSRHEAPDPALYDQLLKLATVEGQEPPYMYWPLYGFKSPLLRAQTLAVAKLPARLDLDDPVEPVNSILSVLESPDPTLRDLGVSVAARRFDEERSRHLVAALLTDFDPHRRMSGAVLAGLTGIRLAHDVRGERVDLLSHLAEQEDEWPARQVMRLGLWMQGRLPEMDAQAPSLLLRDDVPHTTILLAMLHRGHTAEALQWLLNPRGEPAMDLVELFDQRRWWCVLEPYLPDGAPPFWVWADPGLERFQVDVLRDWSLLHLPTER